ncbi:Eaa1 [Klebsiella pneumoniae]|nr:Eaa1 [Klebsiella pneumoniae]
MTNNQLAENSVIQLLNSVKLARDNAERADNRVDHSFYYALTIALEELQERRKADSEPYGFTDGDRRGMIYEPQYADRLNEPLPVYRHAQPELEHYSMFDVVASILDGIDRTELEDGWWETSTGAESGREALEKIRAAMLAAAPQSPGSEPATVPGKWIPVSERMPENDGAYLCWDNRYVTTYAFIFGAWQANQFIAKNITHWMPLPAAPQEVKGE